MRAKMKNLVELVTDYFLIPTEGKEKYALGIFDGALLGYLARDLEQGNTRMLVPSLTYLGLYHASWGVLKYMGQRHTSKNNFSHP